MQKNVLVEGGGGERKVNNEFAHLRAKFIQHNVITMNLYFNKKALNKYKKEISK